MTPDTIKNTIQDIFSRLLVIYSPAGGNGKSEISANLAYFLAKQGKKIWIIDTNIYSPTADIIFQDTEPEGSFIEFLTSPQMTDLPIHHVGHLSDKEHGSLYLTPGGKGNRELRRDILEQGSMDDHSIERLEDAIIHNMRTYHIDLCIIDTHPGFEPVNNVLFALTSHLLVVSRLNDLDIRNLSLMLQDLSVEDIGKKLVVFNNVQYRNEKISSDMENEEMLKKFNTYIQGDGIKKEISGSLSCNGYFCGKVEFFPQPILYSQELALYQKEGNRKLLFSEVHPNDEFSTRIGTLSRHISERFLDN